MFTSTRMQFPVWVLQMSTPSGSGRCGGEDYLYAGDTYFPERQDDTTNKMYHVEHETLPPPNHSLKMQAFLEVEGKMGPIPQPTSNQYRPPQPDTNPNVRKDKAAEKRKGQCQPKDLGLAQSPGLVKQPHTHPQQPPRPQLMTDPKYKKKLQIADPHP